ARALPSTFATLKAAMLTVLIYLMLPLLSPPLPVARTPLFLLLALGAVLLSTWRMLYATVFVQPNFQRRALVVGSGWEGRRAADVINDYDSGYQVIGFVDDDVTTHGSVVCGVRVIGDGTRLESFIRRFRISDVILATHDMSPSMMRTVLKCFEEGVRIVPM